MQDQDDSQGGAPASDYVALLRRLGELSKKRVQYAKDIQELGQIIRNAEYDKWRGTEARTYAQVELKQVRSAYDEAVAESDKLEAQCFQHRMKV